MTDRALLGVHCTPPLEQLASLAHGIIRRYYITPQKSPLCPNDMFAARQHLLSATSPGPPPSSHDKASSNKVSVSWVRRDWCVSLARTSCIDQVVSHRFLVLCAWPTSYSLPPTSFPFGRGHVSLSDLRPILRPYLPPTGARALLGAMSRQVCLRRLPNHQ